MSLHFYYAVQILNLLVKAFNEHFDSKVIAVCAVQNEIALTELTQVIFLLIISIQEPN